MEPECDCDASCNWHTWYCHLRIVTGTVDFGNKRTSGDFPNYNRYWP